MKLEDMYNEKTVRKFITKLVPGLYDIVYGCPMFTTHFKIPKLLSCEILLFIRSSDIEDKSDHKFIVTVSSKKNEGGLNDEMVISIIDENLNLFGYTIIDSINLLSITARKAIIECIIDEFIDKDDHKNSFVIIDTTEQDMLELMVSLTNKDTWQYFHSLKDIHGNEVDMQRTHEHWRESIYEIYVTSLYIRNVLNDNEYRFRDVIINLLLKNPFVVNQLMAYYGLNVIANNTIVSTNIEEDEEEDANESN